MITIGLDLSLTSSGFAKIEDDKYEIKTIRSKPADFKNDLERLEWITEEVFKSIPTETNLVCIEDWFTPQSPKQISAAMGLIQLGTLVRLKMYKANLSFMVINNKQLKKYSTGSGAISKSLVLKEVFKQWNVDANDDNQADAYCLAHLAKDIILTLKDNIQLVKYKEEIVKKVIRNVDSHYNINFS